jgi:outer membrane beta-barrel protein
MLNRTTAVPTVAILLTALSLPAAAQQPPASSAPAATSQVVMPEVDRRELKLPRIPSKDFEIGVFGGTYGTQNFGSSVVGGLRVGYHITEDFFVEGTWGQTKVSDDNYRQVLPGGIFPTGKDTLRYLNLSAGWNVLPGEIFLGRNRAKASQVYLIGGVGTTKFNTQSRQTFNLGVGMKVLLTDHMALRVDMRDHIFSLDLLGKRERTQNLEFTAGLSFFF